MQGPGPPHPRNLPMSTQASTVPHRPFICQSGRRDSGHLQGEPCLTPVCGQQPLRWLTRGTATLPGRDAARSAQRPRLAARGQQRDPKRVTQPRGAPPQLPVTSTTQLPFRAGGTRTRPPLLPRYPSPYLTARAHSLTQAHCLTQHPERR